MLEYTAFFPVISSLTWLSMLLGMLGSWVADGSPHLPSMNDGQTIAYISDIGSGAGVIHLQPLFITGSSLTVFFLSLGFISERWLRHHGHLAPNTSTAQKVLSSVSIIFAVAGGVGLILLTIFDTYHYPTVHQGCLALFMGGYLLSATFFCAEYQRLGIHYRQHRILRISFWFKLSFTLVEFALAIAFGSTMASQPNAAAVCEWTIAFIFTFYQLSFVLDLSPSVRIARHGPQGLKEVEQTVQIGC
jgi:Frag1/DRAM/Sfk1 family